MMKDQIFQEIDDLYPVHHFPKVITNLIMEYKDYEPRLFQHTPAKIYIKERLQKEEQEKEKSSQKSCLVM